MPGYAILDLEIFDKEKFIEYKNLAPSTVKEHNGKIIVGGGEFITLEGNWSPKKIVIIEFPSYEIALNWWASDRYTEARILREKAAKTKLIITNGVSSV